MNILFVAATALSVATPAPAEPLAPKPVTEAAAQDGMVAPKVREQRVCLVDTIIGSNIPRKACHTRSEWRAMNVDLPAGL
ncbi:hypothetical protein ASG29_14515 [Sphingomonas sp. Leaf412]|uniref:hypothetical protein n=1 Tax=Sphingomonas sp. Leaf412 TaxID=1736370 RepID=UPI0006FA065A|nr:hypothetical protein [Sphingomonas sp. Leaf412]KQT31190.1 hypothetical protein ASG29_14515 [Sphingomonas sp. Leaf412]